MEAPQRGSQRAKELFLEALELEGDERARFLRDVRAGDAVLGERVEELLAAHDDADGDWTAGISGVARDVLREGGPRAAGRRIGDYDLIEEVGAGASGVVWRAQQVSLGRQVAVKLLRSGPFAGQREVERFRAEAEAVARLDHPHIVPVHEVGQLDSQPYFSMRWIEGSSLAERTEPMPPREAAQLVLTVARAVHHAHQRGLLHRDLKPSNVLIDGAGEPHVVDFGIAKAMDADETYSATGGLVGTPKYMAPEQTRHDSELTVATDVWALGCILYELLAARPAFDGRTVSEVFFQITEGQPPSLAGPRDLETIVLTCLRKEPGARYASAAALAEDLGRWLAHEPIQARRVTAPERLVLAWKRSPFVASLVALSASLVLALAVGGWWANAAMRETLRESFLGQARTTRLAGEMGRRAAGLELLERAARIRPGDDLRDEAIATLALTDLVYERTIFREADAWAMDLDPTFARFALCANDGFIRIRDTATDEVLDELPCPGHVQHGKYARGGEHLAVIVDVEGRREVVVWDLELRRERLRRSGDVRFDGLDLSPDGSRLAMGTVEGELVFLDISSGLVVHRERKDAIVSAVGFHPDGEHVTVAVGGGVDTVEHYSFEGEVLDTLQLDEGTFKLHWSADGSVLAVACGDGSAHLWTPGEGEPARAVEGHWGDVTAAFLTAGTSLLATSSWDGTSRLWNAHTGRQVLRTRGAPVYASDDGRWVANSVKEGVNVYRLETGSVLRVLSGRDDDVAMRSALFTPDGRVMSVGDDGARLWSLDPWPRIERSLPADQVRALRFLPDGERTLALTARGLELRRYGDWGAGELVLAGDVAGFDLSASGGTVAARVGDTLHVLFLDDRTRDRRIPVQGGLSHSRVSARGRWVGDRTWGADGIRIFDAATGEHLDTIATWARAPTFAFSPDGRTLAVGGRNVYELRRVGSWELLHRIELEDPGGTDAGRTLEFSQDGTWLAVAIGQGYHALIDVERGAVVAELEPPDPRGIASFHFAADGSKLAVACPENFVLVWDLAELDRRLGDLNLGLR